jgi:diguanylate cyclase (GGDEF)-like protein
VEDEDIPVPAGVATLPPAADDVTQRALLRASGVLDPVRDADLDRWVAAVRRNTGASLVALCLFDASELVIKSVCSAPGSSDQLGRLDAGVSFEDHLKASVSAADDGPCLVAEHAVLLAGRAVGQVGVADRARRAWSADDLASLAEAAQAVSSELEARLARAEVTRVHQLVASHNRVHDMIGRGVILRDVLIAVCEAIEGYDPSLKPSVLLRDRESNTLHSGVGPSFPQEYFDSVEGAPVGPVIGTCGSAAWFGRLTVSENLHEDPKWAPIRPMAQLADVAHCWSLPIKSTDDVVLGTLAFYGRHPRRPQPEHIALLEDWARVAGTAIERAQSLDRLTHDARHDGLTGLPNRAAIMERLDVAIQGVHPDAAVAVLFVDLDGLKAVNDTLGHDVADEMIRTMGGRLSASIRGNDFVGRFGGDEFIVVAEGIAEPDEAGRLGARLLEAIAQPLTGITSTLVTASIGIALIGSNDIDAREALRKADKAMYEAKRAGKDRCIFAEIGETVTVSRRLQLARELRDAETRGEMHLVYQPIVSLPTRRIVGVEALLRWTNQTFGDVEPTVFIPIAEDTGSILQIGAWVLREACETLAEIAADGRVLGLSVNISARQLSNPDFPVWVRQTLAHAQFPAEQLTVEISEAALTAIDVPTAQILRALRSMGVRTAVDDFGAGQSSLSWLRDDLFTSVKIDRSLVSALDQARNRAIVAGVIGIAKNVGADVTGEGVETEDQLRQLEALGCDQAQGFHIARPITAASLPSAEPGPAQSSR